MSDYLKDVLALLIGIVLVMLVWRAIGGGTYRLLPDTEMDPRSIRSHPLSAHQAVSAGLERTLSPVGA